MRAFHSIRTKLLLYFLIILVISSSAIGVLSYQIAVRNLKEKVSDSYEKSMELIANNVQDNLVQIQRISDFIYVNDTVKEMIETEQGSYANIKSKDELTKIFTNSTVSNLFQNINSIKIADREKVIYSYVSYGQYDIYDNKKVVESPYFREILDSGKTSTQIMTGLGADFFMAHYSPQESISLFRPIVDDQFLNVIGVMFININQETFRQEAGTYGDDIGLEIDILDEQNRIIYSNTERQAETDNRINNASRTFHYEDEKTGQMIFVNCFFDGWKLIGRVETGQLIRENRQILMVSLLGVAIAAGMTILAWLALSSLFLRPVRELKQVMKKIRTGDFNVRANIVSRDELGELTEDFNYMIDQITQLFRKQLEDESRLKDAQYMALQAQINPHFLYNTLNSIRWMAIIQKEENIKEAVDALVRLLRSTTGKKDKETVAEAVETLKSYTFIQKMAYRCKFEMQWQIEAEAEGCMCPKFLLQPLVENAIYHGIEPKEGTGTITITVRSENRERLYFEILDDGVGMTEEQVERLLEDIDTAGNTFTGIGVRNVNERLILMYGEECRLHFESEPGRYCRVWFAIPMLRGGEGNV